MLSYGVTETLHANTADYRTSKPLPQVFTEKGATSHALLHQENGKHIHGYGQGSTPYAAICFSYIA